MHIDRETIGFNTTFPNAMLDLWCHTWGLCVLLHDLTEFTFNID